MRGCPMYLMTGSRLMTEGYVLDIQASASERSEM